MLLLRKILFYIFAAIYIVFCPLVILYALGYIYEPGTKEGMVKTGLIYVSTAPTGADIYMNGSRYTQAAPAIIRDLIPGEYNIKVTLAEHADWVRTVPVEAEKATVLDKILLLPDKWKTEELLKGTFKDMIPMPGNGLFLVRSGVSAGDIRVYNFRDGKDWPLLDKDAPFLEDKVTSYFTAEDSPGILLRLDSKQGEKFLWVSIKEDDNTAKDITDLFPVTPETIKWLAGQENDVFVFQGGTLNMLDVEKGAVYPDYVQNVRGYGLFDGQLYVLTGDNRILKMGYDKKGEVVLLDEAALGATIFGAKGFYEIDVLTDKFILFRGEDGQLISNRLPYRFAGAGVRGIEPYLQAEEVLVWEKDKIGILDFTTEETGNVAFEKGPSLRWVYTGGKDIEGCFWVYKGSHILFREKDRVLLTEVESYGETKPAHVCDCLDKSNVYYSENTGQLYFIGRNGNLYSLEVVPMKSIVPSQFAKKEEEKLKKEEEREKREKGR